jgi:hypothetical protein
MQCVSLLARMLSLVSGEASGSVLRVDYCDVLRMQGQAVVPAGVIGLV